MISLGINMSFISCSSLRAGQSLLVRKLLVLMWCHVPKTILLRIAAYVLCVQCWSNAGMEFHSFSQRLFFKVLANVAIQCQLMPPPCILQEFGSELRGEDPDLGHEVVKD